MHYCGAVRYVNVTGFNVEGNLGLTHFVLCFRESSKYSEQVLKQCCGLLFSEKIQNSHPIHSGGGERFIPLDSPFANIPNSPHPPIFAAIFRRTTGVKASHPFLSNQNKLRVTDCVQTIVVFS